MGNNPTSFILSDCVRIINKVRLGGFASSDPPEVEWFVYGEINEEQIADKLPIITKDSKYWDSFRTRTCLLYAERHLRIRGGCLLFIFGEYSARFRSRFLSFPDAC